MRAKKPRGAFPHGLSALKGHPGIRSSGIPQDFPDAVRGETVFLGKLCGPGTLRVFPADRPVALVQLGPRAASRSPSGSSVGPGDVDGAALEILPDFVQQFFGKNLFRVDVMDSEPPFLLPRVVRRQGKRPGGTRFVKRRTIAGRTLSNADGRTWAVRQRSAAMMRQGGSVPMRDQNAATSQIVMAIIIQSLLFFRIRSPATVISLYTISSRNARERTRKKILSGFARGSVRAGLRVRASSFPIALYKSAALWYTVDCNIMCERRSG